MEDSPAGATPTAGAPPSEGMAEEEEEELVSRIP